ncbi:MAG: hypothetical protein ACRC80_09565 [Waterburya sp.]
MILVFFTLDFSLFEREVLSSRVNLCNGLIIRVITLNIISGFICDIFIDILEEKQLMTRPEQKHFSEIS